MAVLLVELEAVVLLLAEVVEEAVEAAWAADLLLLADRCRPQPPSMIHRTSSMVTQSMGSETGHQYR